MAELFHSLGIDAKLLFAQALNFGIVLFVLWKFAYKPILKALDERRERIAEGEQNAAAAGKAKSEAEQQRSEVLAEARSESATILAEARTVSETIRSRAVAEADTEKERILKEAAAQASAEKSRAQQEAQGEVADLVVLATEKLLRSDLAKPQARKLAEEALKELKS